jgi:hypothetical protein
MPVPKDSTWLSGLRVMFGWRRVLLVLAVGTFIGILHSPSFTNLATYRVVARELFIGFATLVGFGLFEQWPRRLPPWVARWVLQVIGVMAGAFIGGLLLYTIPSTGVPFWKEPARLNGFFILTMSSMVISPWIAVAALFRQREREKAELEHAALDSRLRLLQAQVEPHFLFNTLANVRELVVSGSPQAATVLDHLITYLRAAVTRLHQTSSTVGQEVQLVRSYLELMHLRMPDRLQFALQVDEAALALRCPPTTLLTLVENAVRHGIDPSEEGGRIDVIVRMESGRCVAEVRDTGAGLVTASTGLGTGLASLRERLELAFGSGASHVRVSALVPRGASAEVAFPAVAR